MLPLAPQGQHYGERRHRFQHVGWDVAQPAQSGFHRPSCPGTILVVQRDDVVAADGAVRERARSVLQCAG